MPLFSVNPSWPLEPGTLRNASYVGCMHTSIMAETYNNSLRQILTHFIKVKNKVN